MQKFPNILHVTGSMRGIALASGIDVGWDPDGPWRALLDAGSVQYMARKANADNKYRKRFF